MTIDRIMQAEELAFPDESAKRVSCFCADAITTPAIPWCARRETMIWCRRAGRDSGGARVVFAGPACAGSGPRSSSGGAFCGRPTRPEPGASGCFGDIGIHAFNLVLLHDRPGARGNLLCLLESFDGGAARRLWHSHSPLPRRSDDPVDGFRASRTDVRMTWGSRWMASPTCAALATVEKPNHMQLRVNGQPQPHPHARSRCCVYSGSRAGIVPIAGRTSGGLSG